MRLQVEVHRPAYEKRFASLPMPQVPGIEAFVLNWSSLAPRHQKQVALSIAPWQRVHSGLIASGSTYYINRFTSSFPRPPGRNCSGTSASITTPGSGRCARLRGVPTP